MSFQIGIAEVDYTPAVGLPLMGNLRIDYSSKGVHDPLFAKAVVFANSAGLKIALVSLDICMLNREQVALMRGHIAGQTDIIAENILIAATHIHSGPATMSIYSMPKAEDGQIEAFLKKAAHAVVVANDNLKTADISLGYSCEDRISFYRRLLCKDNKAHMNWEDLEPDFIIKPLGQIDPQVSVLSIEQEGKPTATLVNFALHPAILDYENDLYSGEYPGVLAQSLAKAFTDNFKTLFFNGYCGNINHINHNDPSVPRRGYIAVEKIGSLLAESAIKAMDNNVQVSGDIIAVSRELVQLKRLGISEEKYQWSLKALEKLKTDPPQGHDDGLLEEYSAETWIQMYKNQDIDDRAEVMVFRIGDIGIVGLPGEVFCEFGFELKQKSPALHTIVIELANDAIGYLPTPEAFEQGGYEPTPGATRYEKDAGQRLTASALDQLNKLFS